MQSPPQRHRTANVIPLARVIVGFAVLLIAHVYPPADPTIGRVHELHDVLAAYCAYALLVLVIALLTPVRVRRWLVALRMLDIVWIAILLSLSCDASPPLFCGLVFALVGGIVA